MVTRLGQDAFNDHIISDGGSDLGGGAGILLEVTHRLRERFVEDIAIVVSVVMA